MRKCRDGSAAIPRDPSSVPITHVQQFITLFNSSFRELMPSFGLLRHYTDMHKYKHTYS